MNSGSKTDFGQPEILVSNHPNSFFDAIIIGVLYPREIYFLARADAFRNKQVARFLKSLHLIPIYRLSEGKENLGKNRDTFEICTRLLNRGKKILIFPEGNCIHEWKLRPLKKGAARLAENALKNGNEKVKIVPITLNYNGFENLPRAVQVNISKGFYAKKIERDSNFYRTLNTMIYSEIRKGLILENPEKQFLKHLNIIKSIVMFPFALIGFATQYWLFFLIKTYVKKLTRNTVFYDSVLFGFLMFLYPVFVIIILSVIVLAYGLLCAILALLLILFTAWCAKELYYNFKISNFAERH